MSFELYVDSLFTSPYAMSAFVALTEKGLPFTVKTVDLDGGQQKLGDYAERALTARVPALVRVDFVLTESSAITEYLEEASRRRNTSRCIRRTAASARRRGSSRPGCAATWCRCASSATRKLCFSARPARR